MNIAPPAVRNRAPRTLARLLSRRVARSPAHVDGLAIALSALTVAVGAPAGSAAGHNLSGQWETPGTHLTLTQKSDNTITWIGGPDNHAWIQTFEGTLASDPTYGVIFTGAFRQDEPGRLPPRYHGTMEAAVQDSCHFRFLSIEQAGMPTLHNIYFVKNPCKVTTKPLARLNLNLYKKRFTPDSRQTGSCPSAIECVVRNAAVIKICNKDDFNHSPFVLSTGNAFGATTKTGKVLLKPGKCYERRFTNTTGQARQVKIYDEFHSQERFIVTVLPRHASP